MNAAVKSLDAMGQGRRSRSRTTRRIVVWIWFDLCICYFLFSTECVGSNPSPAKKSEIFHVSRRIVSERSTDRHAACSVSECSTDRSALRSRQIIHDFDYCHVVLPTLTHSYRRQWTISNGPWPMDMADYSLLPPPSPPLPTTCVPLLTPPPPTECIFQIHGTSVISIICDEANGIDGREQQLFIEASAIWVSTSATSASATAALGKP